MKKQSIWNILTVSLLALHTVPAAAQDAKTINLKSLAATCANCHGTNGKAFEG